MLELTEEVQVDAPLDIVWHDWTNPTSLEEWIWPARLEPAAEVDPQPAGAWTVRSAPASIAVIAHIVQLDPPHVLRLQWSWQDDPDHLTEVEVSLDPAPSGTRVRVVHAGLLSQDEVDSHTQGWADCLARLVERHASPR